jgi:hypothetical protein
MFNDVAIILDFKTSRFLRLTYVRWSLNNEGLLLLRKRRASLPQKEALFGEAR